MRLPRLKKWIWACSVFFSQIAVSQRVVINQNASQSQNVVFGQDRYHISESLYTNNEMGSGNFLSAAESIDKIGFFVTNLGSPPTFTNLRIWMREVPSVSRSLSSGTYSNIGYVQVFEGTVVADSVGILEIPLTNSFFRTSGSNNLMVMIERMDSIRHLGFVYATSNGIENLSTAQSSRRYNDSIKPVLTTTPLTTTNFRPAIAFIHVFPTDIATLSVSYPTISCFNIPQTVRVNIQNQGMSPISARAVTVSLRSRGRTQSTQNSQILQSGDTAQIVFSNINLNTPGTFTDTAFLSLSGDGTRYNDTIYSSMTTADSLTTLPPLENMESAIALVPYLSIQKGSRQLWRLQTNKYSNGDMTPDSLAPQSPGTKFMLFDSWSAPSSVGFESLMFSECIKVPSPTSSGVPVTTVSFLMSQDKLFSTKPDSLYLSVSSDRGVTWSRIQGFSRFSSSAVKPTWVTRIVDISAYTGQTVQLGFEGVSKFGSAFGVDNIQIKKTNPVPLTLLKFKAWKEGAVNRLAWSSAREWDMVRFDVERSIDGIHFEKINEVKAEGEGYTRYYDFEDKQPVFGRQYYRLRMVEVDQRFSFSSVESVDRQSTWALRLENPVSSRVVKAWVSVTSPSELTFILRDMNGKKILEQKRLTITNTTEQIHLPVSVPAGIYTLTVSSSNESQSFKLMIQ